ncbi:MAG: hypothetical protein E7465_08265 [Ruminococcaceae bacterium]|nr:hypothetical protein [Oscillospiraceae bacterium]
MQTVSISVCNLCVPCENRCRYCLLSWDGKLRGVDYDRSAEYARRFSDWLKENRPELGFDFYYGYSMEHPKLLETVDFLGELGSPGGKFLQFDGMKFRSDPEIHQLLTDLKNHGIQMIDLTFYGTRAYHDRFAARRGDFDYMMRILEIANEVGLTVNAGIALNHENVHQAEQLLNQLRMHDLGNFYAFVPHGEGRGASLEPVRFRLSDYEALPESVKAFLSKRRYRTEGEWVREGKFSQPQKRILTLVLTPENVDFIEKQSFSDTIRYLEKLDDDYYSAIPTLPELAKIYGDSTEEKFYSERDLYLKYQRRYIAEHHLTLYDINDERQCFSRRF